VSANGSGGGSGGGGGLGGGGSPGQDADAGVAPPSFGGGQPEALPEVPLMPNAGAGLIPFAGLIWVLGAVMLARGSKRSRRPTIRLMPHNAYMR
jgi:hypothetical protein